MPENPTTPMPDEGQRHARDGADELRPLAQELLASLPANAKDWSVDQRRRLRERISALSGLLRRLGAPTVSWQTLLELATSLGKLSPNGAFPPPPRGPLLERIRTVLTSLANPEEPISPPPMPPRREKPDIPYTRMLFRQLDSE